MKLFKALIAILMLLEPQLSLAQGTKINANNQINWPGPSPWIDITSAPYYAKGDNLTNNATAIQAAINTACAATISGVQETPVVYTPPGFFLIFQPQQPSTASPLNVSCPIHFVFGGGRTAQLSTAPQAVWQVIAGASPNAAALIHFANGSTLFGVTFDGGDIEGYNQSISMLQTNSFHYNNTVLRAQVTGMPDNTPFFEVNGLWTFYDGGILGFNNPFPDNIKNLPVAEMIGGPSALGNLTYLQFFTNVIGYGGCFLYDQRTPNLNGVPSQFVFRNDTIEDCATSFFTVTSSTNNPAGIYSVTLDQARIEDPLNSAPQATFNMDQAGGNASGIFVNHSGGVAHGIIQTLGTVNTYSVQGCDIFCGNDAVDANFNPLGRGFSQSKGGLDFVSDISDGSRMSTPFSDPLTSHINGPALRLFPSGSGKFATLAADAAQGYVFADGLSNGYTAQLIQTTKESLDIGFSTTLPPTGVGVSVIAGGTLTNGTYYYFVAPEVGAAGCGGAAIGAASLISAGATTTTGNNQVAVSWSLPPTAPATLAGFCVFRQTSASYSTQTGVYVPGAGSTSITDTGSNFGTVGDFVFANHMQTFFHVTPNDFSPVVSAGATLGVTQPWGSLSLKGILVSALPSAASNAGRFEVVTDSTTVSAEGQTCTGGSSNTAMAFSNGTVWKCF